MHASIVQSFRFLRHQLFHNHGFFSDHPKKCQPENGFHGKTVIHPSQIDVVNKAYVIKFEEWQDANNILNAKGGVFAGYKGNRMNEVNPHRSWAKKILAKAEIFGVANLNARF